MRRTLVALVLLVTTVTVSANETARGVLRGAAAAVFDLLRGRPQLYSAASAIGTSRDAVQTRFEQLLRERYNLTIVPAFEHTPFISAYNLISARLLAVRHGRGFYGQTYCEAKAVIAGRTE